jgi:predicted Zn-dependent protease
MTVPSYAQGDGATALEREYGVVGRDTDERRKMNDALDRIVEKMSAALGYKPKSAKILGGKDPKRDKEINALALPDGRIYVLAGLMTAAQKTSNPEASVAFVVGHEITHVTEKHARSQMKSNILGAIGGALLARVLGAGASTMRTVSDLAGGLIGGHYSRTHEYEADRGGIIGMSKAGYPVESAAEMMQLLLDRYGEDKSALASWFGSHPNTKNRVLRLKDMGEELREGHTPGEKDPDEKGKDEAN